MIDSKKIEEKLNKLKQEKEQQELKLKQEQEQQNLELKKEQEQQALKERMVQKAKDKIEVLEYYKRKEKEAIEKEKQEQEKARILALDLDNLEKNILKENTETNIKTIANSIGINPDEYVEKPFRIHNGGRKVLETYTEDLSKNKKTPTEFYVVSYWYCFQKYDFNHKTGENISRNFLLGDGWKTGYVHFIFENASKSLVYLYNNETAQTIIDGLNSSFFGYLKQNDATTKVDVPKQILDSFKGIDVIPVCFKELVVSKQSKQKFSYVDYGNFIKNATKEIESKEKIKTSTLYAILSYWKWAIFNYLNEISYIKDKIDYTKNNFGNWIGQIGINFNDEKIESFTDVKDIPEYIKKIENEYQQIIQEETNKLNNFQKELGFFEVNKTKIKLKNRLWRIKKDRFKTR